jgi:hypothetical protein
MLRSNTRFTLRSRCTRSDSAEVLVIETAHRIGILACVLTAACTGTMDKDPVGRTAPMPNGPTPAAAASAFGGGGGPVGNPAPTAPAASAMAGAAAVPPVTSGTAVIPAAPPTVPGVVPAAPMAAADECGLKTKFAGDQFCIKPPPPDKGMHMHVGPSNYENPEPQFVLEPGQEVTEPYNGTTPNDQEVYFFYRQQRMRPGSHHLLMFFGDDLIVSAQNPISDTPAGGKVAPEDANVAIRLPPRARLTGSIHYINTTDKPILKEVWVNFWFKERNATGERANSIFSRAPINIAPGQHVVVGTDCPIMGTGRIIRLFGHKHANNVRWSTYRVRGTQRDLLFEDYDRWEEPLILEYSSITQNAKPDAATKTPGGWSGMIDVQTGDVLRFECEIINNTNSVFIGQNEAKDDEMCIQNGTIVGANIPYACRSTTMPVN